MDLAHLQLGKELRETLAHLCPSAASAEGVTGLAQSSACDSKHGHHPRALGLPILPQSRMCHLRAGSVTTSLWHLGVIPHHPGWSLEMELSSEVLSVSGKCHLVVGSTTLEALPISQDIAPCHVPPAWDLYLGVSSITNILMASQGDPVTQDMSL